MDKVFTFWEGKMPEYIRLCLNTWHFPFVVIDYSTLRQYTDLDINKLSRFTLPQVADCVRVHVLRDHGGRWLDADTICVSGKLPDADIMGNPVTRHHSIGMLRTTPHSDMFERWAAYQDEILNSADTPTHWATMGNAFTDDYIQAHPEIRIGDNESRWPETYMIGGQVDRYYKYVEFYFKSNYTLADLKPTDILMLHNSWTPNWYKSMSGVLGISCTMSNILRELQ